MGKFRLKSEIIDAARWFKNGDHPLDEPRNIGDEGAFVGYSKGKDSFLTKKCDKCGAVMRVHGEINRLGGTVGQSGLWYVCPGSWVLTPPDDMIEILSNTEFMEMYEEVDDRGAPLMTEQEMRKFTSEVEAPKNPYPDGPKPEQQCPTCRFDIEELDVCMKDRRRIQRNEAGKLFKAVNCPFWEFGKELPKVETSPEPKEPKRSSGDKRPRGRPRKFISPDEIYPRPTA